MRTFYVAVNFPSLRSLKKYPIKGETPVPVGSSFKDPCSPSSGPRAFSQERQQCSAVKVAISCQHAGTLTCNEIEEGHR